MVLIVIFEAAKVAFAACVGYAAGKLAARLASCIRRRPGSEERR